jgi:hypothetical protein
MKVSELVAELTGHQPDGQVVIREIDAIPDRILMVESILKEDGKLPLLMGRRIQSQAAKNSIFSEALVRRAFEAHMRGEPLHHKGTVEKSDDGRYRITFDGHPILQEGFETQVEAHGFLRGFSLGFESGAAEKGEVTTP